MDNEYENEEWKPVPDYPGYYVSSYGRVKSLKRKQEKILKPSPDYGGYMKVTIHGNPRRVIGVHKLVTLVFIGKCPDGYEIHHIDHNKENNRLDNLGYVTHGENVRARMFLDALRRRNKIIQEYGGFPFWYNHHELW